MKIILISPVGFAINPNTKYAGIEQLVYNYSSILYKDHDVTVMGRSDSVYPQYVKTLPYKVIQGEDIFREAELRHYQMYQSKLREFDIIHDFSHSHLTARFNTNLPTLNIFWHAPNEVQYPKAPYNIVGLSHWACRMFKQYYKQEARYQQSIAIDIEKYKIHPHFNTHRNNRFLTVGRMAEEKGNLVAVILCKKIGASLDIVGADSDAQYKEQVLKLCDGKQIRYLGEVTDDQKIKLMQMCRGLIYATNRPEVTNHKLFEAILCGAPVVAPAIGALPEMVRHGIDGYLCTNESDFLYYLKNIDKLKPDSRNIREQFALENVVNNYIPLYEKVANGERWA